MEVLCLALAQARVPLLLLAATALGVAWCSFFVRRILAPHTLRAQAARARPAPGADSGLFAASRTRRRDCSHTTTGSLLRSATRLQCRNTRCRAREARAVTWPPLRLPRRADSDDAQTTRATTTANARGAPLFSGLCTAQCLPTETRGTTFDMSGIQRRAHCCRSGARPPAVVCPLDGGVVPRPRARPCATPAACCAGAWRCTVLVFHAADSRAALAACTSRRSPACS
jgi:hypothetical protein